MANALYDKGRESFLKGEISWSSGVIKAVLVDIADYTVDFVNDQFLSDVKVVPSAVVATSLAFTSPTTTAGQADAADITFTAVTGDVSEALVIYQEGTVDGDSRLIAYIDTATGLPVTPNGGDIQVQWSAPIFTL